MLSDAQILERMDSLARAERRAIADSLACLAEVDRRKLFAELAYPTLFEYCVKHLKLSAGAAYRRMHSARAANRYNEIYVDVREGTLSLCVISLLVQDVGIHDLHGALPHCRGKSKREVEIWLASRKPAAPPAPDRVVVRPPLPQPADSATHSDDSSALTIDPPPSPPNPAFEYTFTASPELHRVIERLKDLLWAKYPFGTLDDFLKEAVGDYVNRHDPQLARTELETAHAAHRVGQGESATAGRYIPRKVRNIVWARDGGRCTFTSPDGRRCTCRRGLELDHVIPFALQGRSDDASNIRLLCQEHNQLERRRAFGEGRIGAAASC